METLELYYPGRLPGCLTVWLNKNYTNLSTKTNYFVSMKLWVTFKYGKDSVTDYSGRISFAGQGRSNENMRIRTKRDTASRIAEIEALVARYLRELKDDEFVDEYKAFIQWMLKEGYAGLTIKTRASLVHKFLRRQDPRCKIPDDDMDQIKLTLIPQSKRGATQDAILTKDEVMFLTQHMSIHVKAMAYFMLSTGIRIGAVCKLKMNDIQLYSDPPEVNVRPDYTKKGVGGRIMWFSEEARDYIVEWHKRRKTIKKPGGLGPYDETRVFNYSEHGFRDAWRKVLKRADGGQNPPYYAKRDPSTKIRMFVYRPHNLRKFFSTSMGKEGSYKDKAGVPPIIVNAWLGHEEYLDQYNVLGDKEMANIYNQNMNVVTIFGVGVDEQAREEAKQAMDEADRLSEQVMVEGHYIDMLGGRVDAFRGMSEIAISDMLGKDKLALIMNAVSRREVSARIKPDSTFRALTSQLNEQKQEIKDLKKLVEGLL